MHTTNYFDTLIEIAEDCPVTLGEIPPLKGEKLSVANMQFDMIVDNPYAYTSDEVLFKVFATRKAFASHEVAEQKELWFSKGQPCFRASPLAKRYGWGVHSDSEGRIAIFGAETEEYQKLVADPKVKKLKAMRSKRVKK